MATLEEELCDAIAARNEMAVELASRLLHLASEGGEYIQEPTVLVAGRGDEYSGRYNELAVDIEALTAVILNRAGVPWDAMAAAAGVSKQALHRRLSARGEALFVQSLRESEDRDAWDVGLLIDTFKTAKRLQRSRKWEASAEALGALPYHSRELVEDILGLPGPELILTAAPILAGRLVELKKTRQWWWSGI